MRPVRMTVNYYQQFDADFSLEYPAEGYGGWKKAELEFDLDRTALVVMHAWDCGTKEEYPGWFRCVDYIPRSYDICERVLPPIMAVARSSGMALYHVVRPNSEYYKSYAGYRRALALAGETAPRPETIGPNPELARLHQFRREHVFPGAHNEGDILRGQPHIDFPEPVKPEGDEGIAESSEQLFALCKADGICHLIYTGFAINGCLVSSPGGMVDMQRRGLLCSAIRQAVTAIENKETVRHETAKEIALWQVALLYGFVIDDTDFVRAVAASRQ